MHHVHTFLNISSENYNGDTTNNRPPSDRLTKPQQSYDTSDYAESSLTEDIHKVQEDRARSFLQDFIQGRNSHETQEQKVKQQHVTAKEVYSKTDNLGKLNPTQQINSHFEELRTRQKEEQKMFHQKLMQELTTSTSRTRTPQSFVVQSSGNIFCNIFM